MSTNPRPFLPRESSASLTRSFARAYAALAIGGIRRANPEQIIRQSYGDDHLAGLVIRAATEPASTADFSQFTRIRVLGAIAPGAASVRLFNNAMQLDLDGVYAAKVAKGTTVPEPIFTGEGLPFPVADGVTDTVDVGPVRKMMIAVAVTGELEFYSIEAASTIMQRMLTEKAGPSLDATVFSTTAADDVRDAGLLNGVTPITASNLTGQAAMAEDIGELAGALGAAGCNSDRAMYFAAPRQAAAMRLLAGPRFTNEIIAVNSLIAGTVVAIDPAAIATGYSGIPEIETSKQAVMHYEDTTPLPISSPGTPSTVAAPVISAFQSDLIVIRLRNRLCWSKLVDGAVQVVNSVVW